MNDYQEVEYKMALGVQNFFAANPELTKSNSILKNHVSQFDGLMKDWEQLIEQQNFDTSGYASEKQKAKTALSEIIFGLTSSVHSFAVDTQNDILLEEFALSVSRINKLSDVNFVTYAKTLSHSLQEYAEELKPYQVTADELVNLTKQTNLYSELLLKPAEERKERAVTTANIKKIITKILRLLSDSIDYDMEHYKAAEPAIYEKYNKLREIDDSATHALSIHGTVEDADSDCDGDCPLAHVKVKVKFKPGKAWKEMDAVSSEKGNYQFKGIPDGKCTLTFDLEYYDTVVVKSVVYSDKATKLDVKMKKTEQ